MSHVYHLDSRQIIDSLVMIFLFNYKYTGEQRRKVLTPRRAAAGTIIDLEFAYILIFENKPIVDSGTLTNVCVRIQSTNSITGTNRKV